ncbi:MAG: flagellar hook-basal body complex protein FliE [Buchnera aphidicola (Kaburagia rhusicola rhusicola)]
MFTDTIQSSLNILNSLGTLMDLNEAKDKISQQFVDHIKNAWDSLNFNQKEIDNQSKNIELNKDQPMTLNDVLINFQKNLISTDAIIQVRDKLISSYQDIMNLPV